jgi:hypothetical protein
MTSVHCAVAEVANLSDSFCRIACAAASRCSVQMCVSGLYRPCTALAVPGLRGAAVTGLLLLLSVCDCCVGALQFGQLQQQQQQQYQQTHSPYAR